MGFAAGPGSLCFHPAIKFYSTEAIVQVRTGPKVFGLVASSSGYQFFPLCVAGA